ncbi:MAG: hypothetical protein JNK82_29580 [Myxococcaceae bacterium]|nr:hypothetical protein [Myxococcaceae bacterium]
MKLMGRDITGDALLDELRSRLSARSLDAPTGGPIRFDGLEPRVDPVAFNVEALTEHADPTRPLPLETHRAGLGRAVLLAKRLFRAGGQIFINEALGRQKRFNGHVRDSYAQLAAEVKTLRDRLEVLERPKAPPSKRKAK